MSTNYVNLHETSSDLIILDSNRNGASKRSMPCLQVIHHFIFVNVAVLIDVLADNVAVVIDVLVDVDGIFLVAALPRCDEFKSSVGKYYLESGRST